MGERWLTVAQAAAQLEVSIMWIHRRIAAGLIEVSNEAIAGAKPKYRIAESALQRYFEQHRVAVPGRRRR